MYEYELVRRMFYNDKLSRREISRRTGYHRRTIRRMLQYSSPPGYQMKTPRSKNTLGPFIPIIDQILQEDQNRKKKQRHTAVRIFNRLRDEHNYTGGYTIVKDYVRDKKTRLKEVYLPLEQRPGTAQIDFGQAEVKIAGILQTAHFFCMALSFSDAFFVKAYPGEGFEAVADGHQSSYRFFDGVPPIHLYDNMSTAVKSVLEGKEREVTDEFLSLRSHYLFQSRFCNVARPNEKGVVERLVGYTRRNFFVPIPEFGSWEELNVYLEEQCRKRLEKKASGKDKTVRELLQEERSTFRSLPTAAFEGYPKETRRVSSLCLVRFKTNSYSVPIAYAYRQVTVTVYPFTIEISHKDELIAVHKRSYERYDFVFDPLHYLPLLEKKPGGLDGAMPFTDWDLPECFHQLRRYLEARGGNRGKKEYIEILQLLRDFGLPEVRRGIEKAFEYSCVKLESIKMFILAGREPAWEAVRLSEERLQGLPKVRIDRVDSARYGALMRGGAQ